MAGYWETSQATDRVVLHRRVPPSFDENIELASDGTRSPYRFDGQIKVMLCTSEYLPTDAHEYVSDVFGEVPQSGTYVPGGSVLRAKEVTCPAASNTVTVDAADLGWYESAITARYAVIYDNRPYKAAKKPLLGFVDFGEDVSSSADGVFQITWSAAGVLVVTVTEP
ncbi:hypothetical protein [Rhodococcus jostii]|uniref:hypothetical protein n=1 Tax=Rhodococcus jostii TaxID=132919 RepID=UPI003645815D